ncbi:MAG: hypothetical protein WBO10_12955 [Pyrinomonadaceae bacterium]
MYPFLQRARWATLSILLALFLTVPAVAQDADDKNDDPEKAAAIVARAVKILGGDKYLQIRTQVGKGKFSIIRERAVASFQSFTDIIVFPDKERTDFRVQGSKTIQVNTGDTGWIFDGDLEVIKQQSDGQVADFQRGIRSSLDSLLRGFWKGDAELTYAGRRNAGIGKSNDVVRLTYKDGFVVEFEFSDDGLPQKSVYKRTNPNAEQIPEEDRYAQFIDIDGIKSAFIIDRFTDGKQSSRINFESIEFNRSISDSVFNRPSSVKDAKKDVKY